MCPRTCRRLGTCSTCSASTGMTARVAPLDSAPQGDRAPDRSNHVTVPKGRPPKDKHERRYYRQRWKVERGFAWINNCRRLDRFLEESQKTYRAFMRVFFIKHYLDHLF